MKICYKVVVLNMIFIQVQGIPRECQRCGCCKPVDEICYYHGACVYGCLNGYWGISCNNKCQNLNCQICDRDSGSNCYECKTGFYGKECGSSCAPKCKGCKRRGGECNSCGERYWGKYCNNECGSQCKTCFRWEGCTECTTGYHGSECELYCGEYCASCNIQKGCTSCKLGYYFINRFCLQCPTYCTSCTSSTQCTSCSNDRFGNICQYNCTEGCKHGSCVSTKADCKCNENYTGDKCDQCFSGYYGKDCNQTCSVGCFSDTCSQNYGSCTCTVGWTGAKCDTCADRYFGEKCDKQCNADCDSCTGLYDCQVCNSGHYGSYCQYSCGKGCAENKCNRTTGYCPCVNVYFNATNTPHCNDCVTGRYGQTCEQNCSKRCYSCENESKCFSCHDGHYGVSCQMLCPDGCQADICNKNDGSCSSCKPGYFGEQCSNSCPELCQSCEQNGLCSACKPGYLNTNKQCTCRTDICNNTVNCKSCTNTSYFVNDNKCCLCNVDKCDSCTKTSDTIYCKKCRSGYFLDKNGQCKTCNSQCLENKCDSISGICPQGCSNGYWNQACDTQCEADCSFCNQADGLCLQCKNNTKYGPSCRLRCSTTCKYSMCEITGNCTDGCIMNTFGKQCENKCDDYCLPKNNRTLCSETTGQCLYGCDAGYKGTVCPPEIKTKADKPTPSTPAIGLGVGGGVVALGVIVVVGLFLLRQRKINFNNKSKTTENEPGNVSTLFATVTKKGAFQAEYPNGDTDNLHSVIIIENPIYDSLLQNSSDFEKTPILTEDTLEIDEDDASAREIANVFEESGGVYFSSAKEVNNFKLHVADLPEYVHNISLKYLEEQFQKIPYGTLKACEVSQTKLNLHRNRYKGIYPYDEMRVLVHDGETDYINASYIDGFRRRNAYIATLGPIAKQLGDFGKFWGMVWEQKVEKIVMVTNLVEGEKAKCEQYWPDHYQSKLYGNIEVVCKVDKMYADFIWRQFKLSKNSEERSLHHLQFTSWLAKDVPDNVTSLIELRQRVNALPSTFDGPVIVHCSAGVGRTGTYIALDILTNQGETEGAINIPGCVLNMRQNRPSMIQTLSQYNFLHEALVHSLTLDCSSISREHFHEYMSSKQKVHQQYETIQLTNKHKSDKELQATERNRLLTNKNRKHADIPVDANRPRLYLFLKPGEPDYINAIYINSFKTKNRFLVAQTPLPDTVSDFLTLAVQENCSCIVSMEADLEKHEGIGLYIPGDNQTMTKGMVSVVASKDQRSSHFVKTMLHFKHERKTKKDMMIPHYEYLDWDLKLNIPMSAESFVAFIKEVEDASKSSHLKGPILLHCLNGAGKSGLLCVVSILLEKLIEDKEVSVVNAVKTVKARRPLAIPNKEQFYFCHECVLHSMNATENAA